MISETAKAPMRDWARGPSGTLTASTPASFKLRTPSIIFDGSQPLGGTISTLVTNWLSAILAAKRERSANGEGGVFALCSATLITLPEPRPGLDARAFRSAEPIEWISFDGRAIGGFITRPPPKFAGKRPVLVSIHGGPESQERPTYAYNGLYQYLLSRGIGILATNIRGSTGYGKGYQKLIHRDFGGAVTGSEFAKLLHVTVHVAF